MDSLKSLGPEEQLRHRKTRFAQELVDGAEGEEEREVRLSTLFTMVEERGGKLSRTKEKLFGSSEPSPAKEVLKPSVSETLGVWKWRLLRLSLQSRDREKVRTREQCFGWAVFAYRSGGHSCFLGGADRRRWRSRKVGSKDPGLRSRSPRRLPGLSWAITSRTINL